MEVTRVDSAEVRKDMDSGREVWLVCAYDDDAKFEQYRLKSATPLREFERHALALPRDTEVVFYCG